MSEYRFIDTEKWKRYKHFRNLYDTSPCSISLCDSIDVTELWDACREMDVSFYIAVLYLVTREVNSREEFKLTAVSGREFEYPMPAVWDRVDAVHNVFHVDDETYTSVFTVYDADFSVFAERCAEDIERGRRLRAVAVPCGGNVFEASCIPWRSFTSVGVSTSEASLAPIVAWGRVSQRDGRKYMPLSIQIDHAAADGFHLARFINETEEGAKLLANKILSGKCD